MLDVHDRVIASNGQIDRLSRTLKKQLHDADGFFPNLQTISDKAAVFEECQSQAPTAVGHTIDQPVLSQIP